MKRLFVLMSIMLLGAASSLQAQIKVDEAGIIKKVDKLKADSQDPKKGAKATAWLDLGKAYADAATASTSGLYRGMPEGAAAILLGAATESKATIGGTEYKKFSYPHFDAYVSGGKIDFWVVNKDIIDGALDKSVESYNKAYEVDKASAAKVKDGLVKTVNLIKQDAENNFAAQNYIVSAKGFATAYNTLKSEVVGMIDTVSCFNAGYIYSVGDDFINGEKYLAEAAEKGYENGGDVYYYLYFCNANKKDYAKAKEVLLKGITKFPGNTKIVEGLMDVYTTSGDDPNQIIPFVMKAIEADPKNPDLYAGLGRIYDKLGQAEKSVEAFAKTTELAPNDFGSNFNYGLLLIKNGDDKAKSMRDKEFANQAEYDAYAAAVNASYSKALAPLEKAHQVNPKDVPTVELLKNIYFRLRDDSPSMMENYNKYNTLYKTMAE